MQRIRSRVHNCYHCALLSAHCALLSFCLRLNVSSPQVLFASDLSWDEHRNSMDHRGRHSRQTPMDHTKGSSESIHRCWLLLWCHALLVYSPGVQRSVFSTHTHTHTKLLEAQIIVLLEIAMNGPNRCAARQEKHGHRHRHRHKHRRRHRHSHSHGHGHSHRHGHSHLSRSGAGAANWRGRGFNRTGQLQHETNGKSNY